MCCCYFILSTYSLIHYLFIVFFYSFSELKRRLKAEQKAKEKIEKVSMASTPAVAGEKSEKATNKINEDEISPNEYFKLRSLAVAELKKSKETFPYPHKFSVSTSLEEFLEKYNGLQDGEMLEDTVLTLAGRVHAIRESGAKLIFYDLRGEGVKLQVMANAKIYESEEVSTLRKFSVYLRLTNIPL